MWCGAQAAEADGGAAWQFTGPCRTEEQRRREAEERACAGIPTEALEAGALAKALDSLAELIARRRSVCEDNPFSRFEGSDGRYMRADAALRALGRLKP